MCLAVQSGTPEETTGIGWKVFQQQKTGALYSTTRDTRAKRPRRTWLLAEDDTPMWSYHFGHLGGTPVSEAGFHIYLSRADAFQHITDLDQHYYPVKGLVVRKVRYRQAFLFGLGDGNYQGNAKVIIAKEIYIMEANRA